MSPFSFSVHFGNHVADNAGGRQGASPSAGGSAPVDLVTWGRTANGPGSRRCLVNS